MSDTPPPGMTESLNLNVPTQMTPVASNDHGATGSFEGPPPGMEESVAPQLQEQKFGGVGQQAIAGLEGAARGATLGGSDYLETASGIATPEDILGRKEANPVTSGIGNFAGATGMLAVTGGLGLEGMAAKTGLTGLKAAAAVGAGEGAALGLGDAVSDTALGDPNLNAQKIIANIGIGAVTGGVIGAGASKIKGVLGFGGHAKGSVSETVEKTANDMGKDARTASAIAGEPQMDDISTEGARKLGAPVIDKSVIDGASVLGAPVHEGMVTPDEWTKKLTDALINTNPTYEAKRVGAIYNEGWEKAAQAMTEVAGNSELSGNQLGSALQDSFSRDISHEAEPFNDLYDNIREETQHIPVKENSANAISRNILEIPEVKRASRSQAASLARDVADEISNLKSVDDLRAYQTDLNGRLPATAPVAEKRILGLVQEKLDAWERRAVRDHANEWINKVDMNNPEDAAIWGDKVERVKNLMSNIDATDAKYAPFRQKLSELSEWLGKGKTYGPKDAIDFIQNRLEPEDLVKKLTSTKYAKLGTFMEQYFPEQAALVRDYQKKMLFEKSFLADKFNPKRFAQNVLDLEPEIQKSIFSPEELDKIKAAKDYLGGFPKNYNPSGTANKSSLLAFAESPRQMAVANVRDLYLSAQIRRMAGLPLELRPNPISLGTQLGLQTAKLDAAEALAQKTNKNIAEGASAIFTGSAIPGGVTSAVLDQMGGYKERTNRISELAANPEALTAHLATHTQGFEQSLPNIAQGVQTSMVQALHFLNSKIPRPQSQMPLSNEWKPSNAQKDKFNKYFEAVNDPLSILGQVKKGSLTPEALEAVGATHPELLNEMRREVEMHLNSPGAKNLSYQKKLALSRFLGRPLDETMLPKVMISNQTALNPPSAGPANAAPPKRSNVAELKNMKISSRAGTTVQSLERGE